jgi:hypothetical protein
MCISGQKSVKGPYLHKKNLIIFTLAVKLKDSPEIRTALIEAIEMV